MQSDAVVWQTINHGHCTYKVKTLTQNFCRNEYNVTGLCNRSSCPLANSKYATIREHDGRLFLYVKVPERAHQPSKMWQKIKLKRGYLQALEQLDQELEYWPQFLVHKNKQRLTKITQYLIRMRRLQLKPKPKLLTLPARTEKRDAKREAKALTAARLDKAIEAELVKRLKAGTYGDIYNFSQKHYEKVLDAAEADAEEAEERLENFVEGEGESEEEGEEEGESEKEEGESEEEEEWEEEREYVDGEELGLEAELAGGGDMEDLDLPGDGAGPSGVEAAAGKRRVSFADEQGGVRRKKKPRAVEIEYEQEREDWARTPARIAQW